MASNIDADGREDAPLDPAVERVQSRLRRLLLISVLTTVLGFSAVAFAIVYRLASDEDSETATQPPQSPAAAADAARAVPETLSVALPAGAEVVSASVAGNDLVLMARTGGGAAPNLILVVDRVTGAVAQTIALQHGRAGEDDSPGG